MVTGLGRESPPPGSPRLWFALVYRVVTSAVLLGLMAYCIVYRLWIGLVVVTVFVAVWLALVSVYLWAVRIHYGGVRKALRR